MLKRAASKPLNQSQVSILIEQLVLAIQNYEKPIHRPEQRLKQYFNYIEQMLNLFDGNHDYSYGPHLQVFREAVQDVGVQLVPFGLESYDEDTAFHRDTDQTLSALAERIRVLTRRQKYRRMQYDQRHQAKDLQRELRGYVDGIFTRHARLLVVRVNLYYRAVAQARLRAEHVFDDLDKLIKERRYNAIFDHEIGYICAIEQGNFHGVRLGRCDEREGRHGRGFHAHAAFFFDGSKVRGDVFKAMQIGELWHEITRGRGCYDSSNHNKEAKHGDRLGVGMIHRDEWVRRERLYTVLDYLGKDDQHLRLKPAGARCLRKGLLGRYRPG
ncbi:inovirus-type Gp2 protein [Pseudomonas sp.]|uniref:inovirus-type Gp2 protein n=1 Tax=Pseudomonas sp. TaxID=306 RepID=UPI0028AEECC2|nr:inovirus-type Gp2 protein [Pseudomonas sp.]